MGKHASMGIFVVGHQRIFLTGVLPIAFRWMQLDYIEDMSILVQIMAWHHLTTSHYVNQCWRRSIVPYGVTGPQWVKLTHCPLGDVAVMCDTPQWLISWALVQYPIRHLIVGLREVSKPRDQMYHFEIWQSHRQHCCRCACQISERSDNSKYKSRGFETSQGLTKRRFIGYWNRAQDIPREIAISLMTMDHIDEKSALVHIMACFLMAPSHNMNEIWPYGATISHLFLQASGDCVNMKMAFYQCMNCQCKDKTIHLL